MTRRMRLGTKAGLIAAAVIVQAVVLAAGWLITFRVVQRAFGRVIQERTIEQTREYAERIASLIPEELTRSPEYGSDDWDRLNDYVGLDAFRELPDGGFACIIEPDGRLLCHPEIKDDPSLRDFSFANKQIAEGLEPGASAESLLTAGGGLGAAGIVEFAADNFHYLATRPLPGSGLRLLVHQPAGAVLATGEQSTRWIMGVAAIAAVGVLGVTGAGLGWLLRRYDGVHEALNRQLKQNLLVARSIQQRTLPAAIPQPAGLDIAGWCRPAEETGGDTFDLLPLPETRGPACQLDVDAAPTTRLAFLLADATGHGVGPALAVTQLNAMSRLAWRVGASLLDVASLVNEQLAQTLPAGRFVTAALGCVDAATGAVEMVSAGQGPILLYRAATDAVQTVPTDTYPLGLMPDLGADAATRLTLEPGDILCLISDGLFEASDADGEQFGKDRAADLIRDLARRPIAEIADRLGEAVDTHTGHAPADDDRTVLLIRRAPGSRAAQPMT